MWKCSVVCLLLVTLNTFGANANIIPKSKAQMVIESIPEEDRADFIMFHLAKGVNELHRTDVQFFAAIDSDHYDRDSQSHDFHQNDDEFKNVDVPDDFSRNLVYWVEDNMASFNRRPARRDEGSVCYPSGCVDPGDIGQVCCPF